MQGSCQSKTHLLCQYFFLDMFSHAEITWKMFHNLYAWGAKICSCPNSFFVPVLNNENIKNKIICLNVGTSWVLQETPLKAAFKIPTWVEMLKDTDCDSLKQDRLPKNIWQWSFLFQYEISFYMDMEYQGEVLHLPVFCKRKRFCN